MTLRQFAKILGYSPSTVSKAFSGAKDIKRETRDKILKVADKMGVKEKFVKPVKTAKTIAVIVPEFNSGLYIKMISTLSDCLQSHGAIALFSESGFSDENADRLISYYSSEQKADGIIVISSSGPAKKYNYVPTVYFGKRNDPFADSVYSESFTGICEAIVNFKLLGHRDIAFICEKNTKEKENFFRKALKFYKIDENENFVIRSDLRHEAAGYEGMKKLLSFSNPPTAILAAYDDIAIGAINYAKEKGLSAPDDFSIAGMDNSQLSSNPNIMLSSIDYNYQEIYDILVSRLMKKIDNPNYCVNQKTEIQSSFIMRNSVGTCPKNR